MKILLYYQNPYHTVFLESLVQSFISKGHTVHFLTTCEEGILHEKMKGFGAHVETIAIKAKRISYYIKHTRYLIRYCKKNKIDVVYSHLQFVNLIAVFARHFMKAKVFPCRHHSTDVVLRGNKNAMRQDKLVNRLSKKIIVVSNAVKDQMVKHEGVNPTKIECIPLGYNFDLYDKPDKIEVEKIKKQLDCEFLLLVVGRMTINKRHIIALEVLNNLIKAGSNVKMILMDEGPEKANLEKYIVQHNLSEKVIFTGFLTNTMNYVDAADLLLHPSASEASNQVVKEAALLEKTAIVCKNVGDFEEYFIHGNNGFLVSQDNAANEMTELVKTYYTKKDDLRIMGAELKKAVTTKFAIDKVAELYLKLAQ